jgi:hypothetical protein
MKTRFSILTGIAALALVFGLAALAACSNPTGSGSGGGALPPVPAQKSVYMGSAGGKAYSLEITENTTIRAAYTAKKGDEFKLIIIDGGSEQTCTGTVADKTGGVLTLQPSTPDSGTFKASQSNDGLESITGTITLDNNGGTQQAPGQVEPITLEVDGEQVYMWEQTEQRMFPITFDATLHYVDDVFFGRISGGKLYLCLPSIPENRMGSDLQSYLNAGPYDYFLNFDPSTNYGDNVKYTNQSGHITASPNTSKFAIHEFSAVISPTEYYNLSLLKEETHEYTRLLYVDGRTTVNGSMGLTKTYEEIGHSLPYDIHIVTNLTMNWNNLALKKGWNYVNSHNTYSPVSDNTENSVRTITRTGTAALSIPRNTNGYKWFLSSERADY